MRIYFEDRKGMPLSDLMHRAFPDLVPVGSCNVLRNMEMQNEDMMFYDVVPDNSMTIERFCSLRTIYGDRVLPTPCSEFALIFVLLSIGKALPQCELDTLVNTVSGNATCYNDKTYEKFCKRLIGEFKVKCVINKTADTLFKTMSQRKFLL